MRSYVRLSGLPVFRLLMIDVFRTVKRTKMCLARTYSVGPTEELTALPRQGRSQGWSKIQGGRALSQNMSAPASFGTAALTVTQSQ